MHSQKLTVHSVQPICSCNLVANLANAIWHSINVDYWVIQWFDLTETCTPKITAVICTLLNSVIYSDESVSRPSSSRPSNIVLSNHLLQKLWLYQGICCSICSRAWFYGLILTLWPKNVIFNDWLVRHSVRLHACNNITRISKSLTCIKIPVTPTLSGHTRNVICELYCTTRQMK